MIHRYKSNDDLSGAPQSPDSVKAESIYDADDNSEDFDVAAQNDDDFVDAIDNEEHYEHDQRKSMQQQYRAQFKDNHNSDEHDDTYSTKFEADVLEQAHHFKVLTNLLQNNSQKKKSKNSAGSPDSSNISSADSSASFSSKQHEVHTPSDDEEPQQHLPSILKNVEAASRPKSISSNSGSGIHNGNNNNNNNGSNSNTSNVSNHDLEQVFNRNESKNSDFEQWFKKHK